MNMKNIKKNVAILIWALRSGGAERIAGLLSIYLSPYFNVYIFLADTENIVYRYQGQLVDVEPDHKIEYREENVAKAKEKYNIHYSISFLDDMNYINIRTRKNDYVIVSARCTLSYYNPPHYASMYAMKRYFNAADAIIAVSEGVRFEMINSFAIEPAKITTIYNFIQQESIQHKAMQGNLGKQFDDKKLILSIGRLDEQKNQLRLIRQFAELHAQRNDVKLVIIGSGEKYEELRKEIDNLAITDDVELLPYCENPFIYLAKAYMYVMASHYEGLPNALLEAMCLRIPVVAVDCVGGPRELISDRADYENKITGFVTCPRGILVEDIESDDVCSTLYFRDAMAFMLENADYYKQVKDNESIYMQSYQNESILSKWLSVIEGLDSYTRIPGEEELDVKKKTVIYGAGKLGREALVLCKQNGINVLAFLVSDKINNPSEIEGIPVFPVEDFENEDLSDLQVLLGLHNKYQDEAVNKLLKRGYTDIRFVRFRKENEYI